MSEPATAPRMRCEYIERENGRDVLPCAALQKVQVNTYRQPGLEVEPWCSLANDNHHGTRLTVRGPKRTTIIANFCPFCGVGVSPHAAGFRAEPASPEQH